MRIHLPLASSRIGEGKANDRTPSWDHRHHLLWTLYGHWLPNDLRGSGSDELRNAKFAMLGPIYKRHNLCACNRRDKNCGSFTGRRSPYLTIQGFG